MLWARDLNWEMSNPWSESAPGSMVGLDGWDSLGPIWVTRKATRADCSRGSKLGHEGGVLGGSRLDHESGLLGGSRLDHKGGLFSV